MSDFVRGDCHKCKFEITAECVPRSQKMGFPICYQSTTTNADRIRAMTDEELADWLSIYCCRNKTYDAHCETFGSCEACWLDWLKEEAKE